MRPVEIWHGSAADQDEGKEHVCVCVCVCVCVKALLVKEPVR